MCIVKTCCMIDVLLLLWIKLCLACASASFCAKARLDTGWLSKPNRTEVLHQSLDISHHRLTAQHGSFPPVSASTPFHHGTSIWPLTLPCIVLVQQQQQHLGQLAAGPLQQPCMWMWPCQRSSCRSPGLTSTRCPSLRRQLTSRRWCAVGWTGACRQGRAHTHPSSSIKSSGRDRSVSLLTNSEQK